jgi:hypothetical protein
MIVRKILGAAATKGIGYYPVVSTNDPYYDKVSLLLNGDTDVDTNFANVSLLLTGNDLLDKSNNKATVTTYGNAAVTSINKKFGTGSYYFDGNRDYLTSTWSTLFSFGTGDFTVEFWCYPQNLSGTSSASQKSIFDLGSSGFQIGIFPSNIHIAQNMVADLTDFNSSIIQNNTWFHVALSRSSNVTRCFINGVQAGSNYSDSTNYTGSTFVIGAHFAVTSLDFQGYVDDLRITKGIARYTTNFTPPTAALPSHEILDSSVYRLPVTTYGSARIDTANKKYGTGAMYFDGVGDYLTVPANNGCVFGTGDFTVEGWYNITSHGSMGTMLWNHNTAAIGNPYMMVIGNKFAFGNTGNYPFAIGAITLSLNTWYHLALSRSSGSLRLFVNGVLDVTASVTTDYSTSNPIGIFTNLPSDNNWTGAGYADDVRITKGTARYTANFTPPTAALPTIPPTISADPWWGNVSLLLDGNTTDAYDPYWQNVSLMLTGDDFIDWSNQHNAVTNNGTVTLNSSIKKYNSSSYDFSSTGRYLSMPTSSNFELLSNNFTIELWAYRSGNGTGDRFIIDKGNSSSFLLRWQASNSLQFFINGNGVLDYPNFAFTLATWYHIAVVRNGNLFTLYINGVSVTTGNSAASVSTTTANLAVCANSNSGGENFQGYLTDIRITKGIARYTANFTPPIAALPSYKIQDRTQNNLTLTPYGNVQLSTDVMKNGTGSMFFDGTGDLLRIAATPALEIGAVAVDFTIEAWVYPIAFGSSFNAIVSSWEQNSINDQWIISTTSTGAVGFYWGGYSIDTLFVSGGTVSLNQWSHVAVCKSNTVFTIYVNGVQAATATNASTANSLGAVQVGYYGSSSSRAWNGYIDDLRITKGYARYTQNFTPPSQSFATQYISTGYDANYADVSLLLNGNGTNGSTTFTDLSGTPKTITAYGNAKISTAVKKYGTGAMAFDGNSDYLSVPYSTNLLLNSVNSTLEGWFYLNASPGGPGSTAPFFCQTDITNSSTSAGSNFWCFADGTYIYFGGGGQSTYLTAAVSNLPINQWFHIAVVITAGVSATVYINGVSIMSGTINAIGSNSAYSTFVGACKTGAPGTLNSLNGYADDLRITKGIARYTTNFTPPTYQLPTDTTGTVIDPLRSSTSLLLRGNGTNGSTSFTDESPNGLTVNRYGSVVISTAQKKYGTGAIYNPGDGTGNHLTIASNSLLDLAGGQWTVEMWVYPTTAILNNRTLFSKRGSGGCSYQGYIRAGTNAIGFYNGTEYDTGVSFTANVWCHIAYTYDGSTVKIYKDGTQIFSSAIAASANNSYPLYVGTYLESGFNLEFPGYIDDFRITKGYARYTSNFTPPTYEDPIVTGTVYDYNYPQVSLLLNGDGTNGSTVFKDLSSSPKTVTNTGSVAVNTSVKKFGTGSMAFNGGNYLSVPTSSAFSLGTNDFTIECWLYFTSNAANQTILALTDGLSGQNFTLFTPSAGTLSYYLSSNGSSWNIASSISVGSISANQWYHFSLVRIGTTFMPFLNGTIGTTTTSSAAIYGTSNPVYIGASTYQLPTYVFTGYMDDLRITKGLARYTQNFTPPTAPLPTSYS